MPLWATATGTIVCALAAAMLAMVGLSAGTAYGTDYHDLTPRQRAMAKLLSLGALLLSLVFAGVALILAAWTIKLWMA